jgi:hypothetical protein
MKNHNLVTYNGTSDIQWYDIGKKYGHNKGVLKKGECKYIFIEFIQTHNTQTYVSSLIFDTTSKNDSFL